MSDLKQYTILVVDDEEELRNAIAFDFKRKGFQVVTAKNGQEAFKIVLERKMDLVISDIRMPGGGGISLLEQIRAHDPSIPVVIFITGFADVTEEECVSKGAKCVFNKPFKRKDLMDAVLSTLGVQSKAA